MLKKTKYMSIARKKKKTKLLFFTKGDKTKTKLNVANSSLFELKLYSYSDSPTKSTLESTLPYGVKMHSRSCD